jgi:hypothetical protein
MDYEAEIRKLAGETIALQAIIANLCSRLDSATVSQSFDDAASFLELITIRAGSRVSPDDLAQALKGRRGTQDRSAWQSAKALPRHLEMKVSSYSSRKQPSR